MVNRRRAHDINEAAARFAETLADSYKVIYGQAAESTERQQRLARAFSELVASNLREQTESGRAAERLSEQASKQQEAGQALARESVEAYIEFLDAAFSRYRTGTERAAGSVQEGAMATGRTADDVVGAATSATSRTVDATTESAERMAETATFPIAGYDEMNVEEVSERLDALTDEQIRRLRDYERSNQNRKTLMDRFESRLRASS